MIFSIVKQVSKYRALHKIVRNVLNTADPIGFIAAGCPEDEYDPEVKTIIPRLHGIESVEQVKRILHEEFVLWFDEVQAGQPQAYESAAREIYTYLKSHPID